MKRAKHFLAHKRHWLWYSVSALSTVAGAVAQIISPETHPYGFMGITLLGVAAGLSAQVSRPQDVGDDA